MPHTRAAAPDVLATAPRATLGTVEVLRAMFTAPDQPAVACHASLFEHGKLTDLGTLGGCNSAGQNKGIINRGQVVGVAETAMTDPTGNNGSLNFSRLPMGTWPDARPRHTARVHRTATATGSEAHLV